MAMTRRELTGAGGAALALGAGLAASANAGPRENATMLVLVHGAWHGAWCFGPLVQELALLGQPALAVDLPGHGLDARVPSSWSARPFDRQAFATERSPVAGLALQDYAAHVQAVVHQLQQAGHRRIVLVGHSLAGVTLTQVAEQVPGQIHRLVYLAAFMLAPGERVADAVLTPEGATAKLRPLIQADPAVVGASRFDPASPDAGYQAHLRAAFYGDLDAQRARAASQLLVPDEPAALSLAVTEKTVQRWGRVPRHYIACLQDQAIPIALQRRFIDRADAFTPGHRTSVHEMDTSHSPFLSAPAALAGLLVRIANA